MPMERVTVARMATVKPGGCQVFIQSAALGMGGTKPSAPILNSYNLSPDNAKRPLAERQGPFCCCENLKLIQQSK